MPLVILVELPLRQAQFFFDLTELNDLALQLRGLVKGLVVVAQLIHQFLVLVLTFLVRLLQLLDLLLKLPNALVSLELQAIFLLLQSGDLLAETAEDLDPDQQFFVFFDLLFELLRLLVHLLLHELIIDLQRLDLDPELVVLLDRVLVLVLVELLCIDKFRHFLLACGQFLLLLLEQ